MSDAPQLNTGGHAISHVSERSTARHDGLDIIFGPSRCAVVSAYSGYVAGVAFTSASVAKVTATCA